MSGEKKKIEISSSLSILIAGVVIAAAIVLVNQRPAAGAPSNTTAAGAPSPLAIRPPSPDEHIVGSAKAPIVIVEYSDFQCPFCSMIYPSIKNIVNASNGQVAWVQRSFPLASIHPQAEPAANAAECITAQLGNAGYWRYADAVFGNQSALSPEYSAQLAKQFGADTASYIQCVDAKTYQGKITTDMAEAEAIGGQGTPFTVVVNTKTGTMVPFSGALPQAQIEKIINTIK